MSDGFSVHPTDDPLPEPTRAPDPAPLQPAPGDVAMLSDWAEPARPTEFPPHAATSARHGSPETIGVAGLLFCGGFHSSMQGNKARHCRALAAERGLDCHRFDYRGHGASRGDAAGLGIEHWLNDALSVLDRLPGRQVLIGSSMGAWLSVLAAQARPDRIAGVLTLAAAPDFTERLMRPALHETQKAVLKAGGMAFRYSEWDSEPWPIPPVLLDSGRRLSILRPDDGTAPMPLGCPLAVLHGSADADVPSALSLELFDALGSPGDELVLLHGGEHRLSDPRALGVFERLLDGLLLRTASLPSSTTASHAGGP